VIPAKVDFEQTSIKQIKELLESETGVASNFQKLLWKGAKLENEMLLKNIQGLKFGSKLMMVGTPQTDVAVIQELKPNHGTFESNT
jgi:hypothetical protein